jgi:phosphate transport system substrate-binding protein
MEYGYAIGTKLKMAKLENKAGKIVEPSIDSAQASLASVAMPDDLVAWLPDPEGDASYPIVTYTWIMAYKKYADPQKAKTLKQVLEYCLTDGQTQSAAVGYVPLPSAVVPKIKAALEGIQAGPGEAQAQK